MKRTLPECGRYDLGSYLPVYLWKQALEKEEKDPFAELLNLLRKYPDVLEETEETDDSSEVSNYPVQNIAMKLLNENENIDSILNLSD